MADHYRITAERMNETSKLLHANQHYHNSCYTSGYVAECYLKLLLSLIPGTNPRAGGHNIANMDTDLSYFATSGANVSIRSRIDMQVECPRIMNSWNPNKRYNDNCGWNNAASNSFQLEQEKCYLKIIELFNNGLIS